MKIADVMRSRGTTDVVTVQPTQTVTELLSVLAEHGIGAVVVSADGASVDGIVSERDIVRKLNERGAGVLEAPVSDIMTSKNGKSRAQTLPPRSSRLATSMGLDRIGSV